MAEFRARRYTAQDGLTLYFRDYGDPLSPRVPLLCLPGLTRNSADFARLAARCGDERRVLCPDYRGRGRSDYDPDWRGYTPRTYLDDIAHLMAAAGIGRVVALGTSMGGLLAMGLAVLKPNSIAGAVLNDVGPEIDGGGLGRIIEYISVDRPQPDWPSAARYLQRTLPELSLTSAEDWLSFARGTYREGADGALHFDWDLAIARALTAGTDTVVDLWAVYAALGPMPVLALRGECSDILTEACFARMAEAKPDLRRVTVPGVGHAPSLRETEARSAIDDFLAGF